MEFTDVIGRFGPWQRRILFVLMYRACVTAFVVYNVQLIAPQIGHWCISKKPLNFTTKEWKSCCIPEGSSCKEYVFDSEGIVTNTTVNCDTWEFESDDYSENFRHEWNLVCDRSWLVSLSNTALTIGNFISYIPSGHISDKFGRRRVSIIGLSIITIIGVAGYFSPNIEFFIAHRLLAGLCYGFFQTATICGFLESVGPEYRSMMSLAFVGTFGFGTMILPGLALLANNWRTLQLISYLPFYVIAVIAVWKFFPESPKWLLSVGKYDEAEKIIAEGAKVNGKEVTDMKDVIKNLKLKIEKDEQEAAKQKKTNFFDLFRTATMRKMTLLLYLTQFLTVFIYYGFSLSLGNLGGSLYMNMFFMGLAESLSAGVFLIMAKYLTRRRALLLTFFLSGLSFFISMAIPDDLLWLRITVAILGRTCNSLSYTFLWLFEAEIFPTNLRSVGVGGGMCAGRLGSILATFMEELGRIAGRNTPIGIFGAMAIVSSVLFLLLPETKDKHLPDTIKQSERLPETEIS